jgi:nonsense-mediated mRNA decay protein 3
MAITDRFCPKCGGHSEREGLCDHCKVAETRWLTCERRVQSIHCPSCGAQKQGNVWSDTDRERTDLAMDLARSAVHLHPELRSPRINVKINTLSTNRSRATITVQGVLYHQQVTGSCDVEIAWNKEQCDRCNRISGSYYEGIVQVRALDRIPGPYECQMAAAIASEVELSLQTGGERLSFISDMSETTEGLDIVVGSQHIGLLIAQKITAQLGGRYTTHPKLIGEKNGRPLYRITYSVRLPRYQKRDVIRFRGRYAEVIKVESNFLRVFDFTEGNIKTVREEEVDQLIGNARDAVDAMVAFAKGDTIGVIDPDTYATHECAAGKSFNIRAGQYVRTIRDGDHLVILR